MPPKRKPQDADSRASATPAKRQRVSRACDQCRSAREKCDGTQPQCFSCISLGRDCSYNVAPKKRGVQTGLIRTLESALVWVFEQYPGADSALNDLLTQQGPEALSIGKETDAGNRLHRRWKKSKTRKEIDRLLAGKDGASPRPDASDEDESTTEPDPEGAQRTPRTDASTCRTVYRLPTGFSRLLDVYFTYTHCWLPILDKARILSLASSCQAREIRDPELWCALAVASYQDPSAASQVYPSEIFSKARSLLPVVGEEDSDADLSMVDMGNTDNGRGEPRETREFGYAESSRLRASNSYLLLSLVKLGQDEAMVASLLIGLAARTIPRHPNPGLGDIRTNSERSRTLMACCLLDTLTSLRLGQTPHTTATSLEGDPPLLEEGPEEWDTWSPLSGFESTETIQPRDTPRAIQSISSFNQLFKFARVLGQEADTRESPADLAAALDPRFSFCNSILGGSTPFSPTAFLLQASFLGATMASTPGSRISLVWALMEAVEHSWERLGPGVSPLLVTYMSMASKRTQGLGIEDKNRWDALLTKLKSVWQQRQPVSSPPKHTASSPQAQVSHEQSFDQALMTPPDPFQAQTQTHASSSARSMALAPSNHNVQGFQGGTMNSLVQVPPYLLLQGQSDPMIDHDAILDELASIDCTDSMDADPQFMANLGFAPGSDFTDMRGEFGAL